MKKLFALLLAAMMALSLVACGGSSDTTSDSTDSAAGNTEEPVTLTAIVAGLTEDSPSGEALKNLQSCAMSILAALSPLTASLTPS